MSKKWVSCKIITSDDEDTSATTDSNLPQFLRACQPEIDAGSFNNKFVSISNECVSLLKELAVTTQNRNKKFTRSKPERNPSYNNDNNYSRLKTITFSFLPVVQKGSNYRKYCLGWLAEDEKPSTIQDCVLKYTSGSDWYCSEVNFALASDSSSLKTYGSYIKQLKYCICKSPGYAGTVYRGVQMSTTEIAAYESQNMFFMPSFTSTSKTTPFDKNTLIHIDITPEWSKFCMDIRPSFTKYANENEVLLSCYNLYRYERTEKSNNKRIIKLSLVDYEKYFDYRTNTIQQ